MERNDPDCTFSEEVIVNDDVKTPFGDRPIREDISVFGGYPDDDWDEVDFEF